MALIGSVDSPKYLINRKTLTYTALWPFRLIHRLSLPMQQWIIHRVLGPMLSERFWGTSEYWYGYSTYPTWAKLRDLIERFTSMQVSEISNIKHIWTAIETAYLTFLFPMTFVHDHNSIMFAMTMHIVIIRSAVMPLILKLILQKCFKWWPFFEESNDHRSLL